MILRNICVSYIRADSSKQRAGNCNILLEHSVLWKDTINWKYGPNTIGSTFILQGLRYFKPFTHTFK
jgi:hypothetical protein